MKRTFVALVAVVFFAVPAFAQYVPQYDWSGRIDLSPKQDYAGQAQRNSDRHENWIHQQQMLQQRRTEERRREWNRWQDNMRPDDGRQQSWDSQPGWEW